MPVFTLQLKYLHLYNFILLFTNPLKTPQAKDPKEPPP
jgi:hypothetical protein